MNPTHRFRYLIYFAAFMLVMSVCFVYAEPAPSPARLLFQTAPQHVGFLTPCASEPVFDASLLRTAVSPVVSLDMVLELQSSTHARRGFLHRNRRPEVHLLPSNARSESSVLEPSIAVPALGHSSAAASIR